jgi:hypothetical protein
MPNRREPLVDIVIVTLDDMGRARTKSCAICSNQPDVTIGIIRRASDPYRCVFCR